MRFPSFALALALSCGCAAPTTRAPFATGTDASGLVHVEVDRVHAIPATVDEAEPYISRVVVEAAAAGLPVAIAGARHSMGGQTLYPGAALLDMTTLKEMELLADGGTLRVGAGAKWSDVIPYLDARGRAPAIMQSNNDFTVGGSASVNCHGWQVGRPPIADSVRAVRVVRADGSVVRCSRTENADLFRHVLGGYGMFGVITEVELETVPNVMYSVDSTTMAPEDFDAEWTKRVSQQPDVQMAYGRFAVDEGHLFEKVLLTTFTLAPGEAIEHLSEHGGFTDGLSRDVFRAGVDSNAGKRTRWLLETNVGQSLGNKHASRNNLLNAPSAIFAERDADRVDILHEYFVPRARFADFLRLARGPILARHANLMNVTVRHVMPDCDTALPYAREECFSFVMLFNHPKGEAEEYSALARELVQCALECGGTHYLPYRLDATPEQFRRAYPMAEDVLAAKDREDPRRVFRNMLEEWARRE